MELYSTKNSKFIQTCFKTIITNIYTFNKNNKRKILLSNTFNPTSENFVIKEIQNYKII